MTNSCVLYANDLTTSVDFYKNQLGFSLQSSNDDCAHLQLGERHLTLCRKSATTAPAQSSKKCCLTLSQRQLQQLLKHPELLERPFMAIRGNSAEVLPLMLRDPAGNRLATCFSQTKTSTEKVTPPQQPVVSNKPGWRQQLARVFSELAEFNGYRR